MKEFEGDQLLNIQTAGTQWIAEATLHHNRYEPTPYEYLQELFTRYPLKKEDGLVDFGCGKGRLNFYVHNRFGCRATGIELNTRFCGEAQQNLAAYSRKNSDVSGKIRFQCRMAQDYDIEPEDTVFYFFNPFSVQIFMKVVDNILRSVESDPRKMDIILYYPSRDYIDYLERGTVFELHETLDLPVIRKDPAEQFQIYRFSPQMI